MIKHTVSIAIAMLSLALPSLADITINAPSPGLTSGSPVHFSASATSSSPITAMRIYVDDMSVFETAAAALDAFIPMSMGSHNVVVQAWDALGRVFKSPQTIVVTGGITMNAPLNGSQVGSPMRVVASASSTQPISQMVVYLDNNNVSLTNGGNLDASIPVGPGPHSLVVQAWDTSGALYRQALAVQVDPSIPANALTKSGIQSIDGWQSCTVCAGAGGNGTTAGFSLIQSTNASLSGQSAQFNLWGATPYSNAIWWKQLGGDDNARNFKYDLDFYLTAPSFSQALEFDVNQSIGALKFIFGTQCNLKDGGQWDVWDAPDSLWQPTGIPCLPPAANVWHHLTWEFQRSATQTEFIAVTLDGNRQAVNQAYNATPVSATEINVAFQMDGDFAQHPYSVWLDNITLSYW